MLNESVKPANVPMKVRLVRHDGVNWYTDAEIGNEYEVLKVNPLTYTIKTNDKYSTGLFKDHCEIIYPLPQEQIFTQEEWKERCRLLVLENDELLAENVKLRKTIDHRNILLDKYETMIRRLNHE